MSMKISNRTRVPLIALGTASRQTKGADGLFTDEVLKSRITGGLATE
jgi:hypothetical protein